MRDGASGRSRGFGFLTFKDARTVNIVMVKEHYLDGKIVRPHSSTSRYSLFRSGPSSFSGPHLSYFCIFPRSSPQSSTKSKSSQIPKIDPKRAIPRDEQERTSKIFVGGVSQEATEQDFKEYFMQFGRVIDATLMMDKDTGRPRGFGFVTFDSEAAVEACLEIPLEIHGKPIEVKKAQPRGNVREEEDRGGRNRFRKPDERDTFSNQGGQQQQGMGGMGGMGAGGMTPQLMAQYWQRMQAYFAMMQQQMAMGRGGAMNPAMMQQMQQMQAMQAMQAQMAGGNNAANMGARSQSPQGPQSPNVMQGMNPAMLAQMQQMQQMQAMQAMQGAGGPGAQAQAQGRPAFNAYEQQQFEQQKYEQQSRGQYRGSRDQSAGAYGGQQPTSWEGMYDDVPQPIQSGGGSVSGASGGAGGYGGGGGGGGGAGFGGAHRGGRGGSQTPSGPGPAPPAGAPTGPKNAGKPGANYRGGGRGGRGGFHPYSRG
jgi:RNA-binding protein Musashi